MPLKMDSRRRWLSIYESINTKLDKLSKKELNYLLKNKIDDSEAHLHNTAVHITEEERQRWNDFNLSSEVSTDAPGLITANDRRKLRSIEDRANRYTHPTFSYSLDPSETLLFKPDENGHIVDAIKPDILNTTVDTVSMVNSFTYNDFIRVKNNKVFNKLSSPKVDHTNPNNIKKLINRDTLESYSITSTISRTDYPPENTGQFWLQNSTGELKAFDRDNNRWVSVQKVVKSTDRILKINPETGKADITKDMITSSSLVTPIGTIIFRYDLLNDLENYLPCDGRMLKRSDYPELFEAIDNNELPLFGLYESVATGFTRENFADKLKSDIPYGVPFVSTIDSDTVCLPIFVTMPIKATYVYWSSTGELSVSPEDAYDIHNKYSTRPLIQGRMPGTIRMGKNKEVVGDQKSRTLETVEFNPFNDKAPILKSNDSIDTSNKVSTLNQLTKNAVVNYENSDGWVVEIPDPIYRDNILNTAGNWYLKSNTEQFYRYAETKHKFHPKLTTYSIHNGAKLDYDLKSIGISTKDKLNIIKFNPDVDFSDIDSSVGGVLNNIRVTKFPIGRSKKFKNLSANFTVAAYIKVR